MCLSGPFRAGYPCLRISPETDLSNDASYANFVYTKLNDCYEYFYKVFFGNDTRYGTDFEVKRYDDDGIYEDVDTSKAWGALDVIQEETDSEYYRSLDYCENIFRKHPAKHTMSKQGEYEDILVTCEGYLDKDRSPGPDSPEIDLKLYPKTIRDQIFNFKKDFTHHNYANIDYTKRDQTNVNLDRRTKNEILRKQFFLSNSTDKNDVNDKFNYVTDKNVINDKFNRLNDKKIECHSIKNDVTKKGADVNVSGALSMKLLNLDRYNRVLTTTETFMETAEASFTKKSLNIKRDDFESFVKRSENYYTSEHRDRHTDVYLNNETNPPKGKTEIRIVYNPTFLATESNSKNLCHFCNKRCSRTSPKCCPDCVCVVVELRDIWKENWLNILLLLGLIFVLIAIFVQWLLKNIGCDENTNEACFEMST